MSYTFGLATPEQITGRIVSETRDHIAVAVVPDPRRPKQGVLLAVRRDGEQYVTWEYGWNMAEDGITVWWGRYFAAWAYGSHGAAFDAGTADLKERTKGYEP